MIRPVLLGWMTRGLVVAALVTPGLGQRPALGEPAPMMPLVDLDGKQRALSELSGPRGLVILFWATWSERSLAELTRLNANEKHLRDDGVAVAAVNVDHQNSGSPELARVRESVTKLALTIPVLIDDGLKLFQAYGVISVPSTALVNTKGELRYFAAGYGPSEREALFDAVDALAGRQRAAPPASLPAVPAAALRKLQAGRVEVANRRVEAAKATFSALAEADPSFVEPIVELAAIAIDERDAARADGLLTRALGLQPDHGGANRERARALFIAGNPAEAEAALQKISRGTDPVADAYLGFLLSGRGRTVEAAAAFEHAKAAGGADPGRFLPENGEDRVAEAMAAYRRAAARPTGGAK